MQVPLTRASHASILTGLYPFQHGIRDNFAPPLARRAPHARGGAEEPGLQDGWVRRLLHRQHAVGPRTRIRRVRRLVRAGCEGHGVLHRVPAAGRRGGGNGRAPGSSGWPVRARRSSRGSTSTIRIRPMRRRSPTPRATRQHLYEGEVAYTDEILGRLLGTAGHGSVSAGRTLVIVTSDHGEALGEHGEEEHGFFVYDATVRVPLLIRLPGRIAPGVRVKSQAQGIDLVPTILDLAGVRTAVAGLARTIARARHDGQAGRRPRCRVFREPVPSAALRLERPEGDQDGRVEVHPGAAAGTLRPDA